VKAAGEAAWTGAVKLAERAGRPGLTLWWHPEGGVPRIMAGRRETTPATVFEQVYPAMGDQVRRHALERLGPVRGQHGWDLYSGIGESTTALLGQGATVESVELDRRAVEWAGARLGESAAMGDQLLRKPARPARLHVGLVERVIGSLDPATFAVVNPPRTGMAPAVLSGLIARPPRRLVYISCDPATLARDLGRLCGGAGATGHPTYRLRELQPFDLFPQTAHLETVAVLEAA
jgi:23S rRNA (uracil1939-C5)-methyltransferase